LLGDESANCCCAWGYRCRFACFFADVAGKQGTGDTHRGNSSAAGERHSRTNEKDGVPGLAIAVIRGGKTIWLHGFGMKEVKTAQPVTAQTVFEAASLSKPVFTYAVLKLVEQGKLGLDVPLTTYLPKPFIAGDERLAKITARLVLSHRTGFPNWPGDDGSVSIYFTPGERFSYSGEGYIYLQRVVEKITGRPLNEYMTEAVFTPLE